MQTDPLSAKFAALAGIKYQTFAGWRLGRIRSRDNTKVTAKPAEEVRWLEAVVSEAQQSAASLKVNLPGGAWVEVTHAQQTPLIAALVHAIEKPVIAC